MGINYQQTDTAGGINTSANAVCATASSAESFPLDNTAADGGAAGSTPVTVSGAGSATRGRFVYFEITPAAGTSWAAGNWTVRLNVTTANMNLTWESVWICRTDSADANIATLASSTTVAKSLGATGVQSITVSGSSATPNAGDKVVVVCGVANSSMSTVTAGITPDQFIDSPFTAAAVDPSIYAGFLTQSVPSEVMRPWRAMGYSQGG